MMLEYLARKEVPNSLLIAEGATFVMMKKYERQKDCVKPTMKVTHMNSEYCSLTIAAIDPVLTPCAEHEIGEN